MRITARGTAFCHRLLNGGDGTDLISGGRGDDCLIGGNGGDFLIGNAGNDILDASTDGISGEFLNGGPGVDGCVDEGLGYIC